MKVLFRHGSLFALRNHLSGAGVWEDKRGGMRRAAKLSLDVGEIAAEAIAGSEWEATSDEAGLSPSLCFLSKPWLDLFT